MADDETDSPPINVTIKGPSGLSLPISISPDATVRKLKEEIAAKREDFPADSQRVIYSGKVLKDELTVKEYKVQNGHTLHMVRSAGAKPPGGSAPAPAASTAGASSTTAPTSSPSSAAANAEARGVPSTFGAGQTFTNNPLAALNRADLAGPHLANFNPFQGMGGNQNDPNFMMTLMQDEGFRQQMRGMLSRPEVVDQIISMNPQLQPMRAQLSQMLQSEHFREMLTNPEALQQAQQMASMFGGQGGLGGGMLGGLGGLGGAGGAAGGGAGAQWPPAGAFGTQGGNNAAAGDSNQLGGTGAGAGTGAAAGTAGAGLNLFEMLGQMGGAGGLGGAAGAGAGGAGANPFGMNPEMMRNMMQAMGGAGGGLGGLGSPGAGAGAGGPPPEERYAQQLEQMQGMGFTDGARNLRALLISGGNVEGALNLLLEGTI